MSDNQEKKEHIESDKQVESVEQFTTEMLFEKIYGHLSVILDLNKNTYSKEEDFLIGRQHMETYLAEFHDDICQLLDDLTYEYQIPVDEDLPEEEVKTRVSEIIQEPIKPIREPIREPVKLSREAMKIYNQSYCEHCGVPIKQGHFYCKPCYYNQ